MKQNVAILGFETPGRGLTDISHDLHNWLRNAGVDKGLLTLLCQHTSASLLITEKVSPDAHRDLGRWLDAVAPDGEGYEHGDEGPDDMPAHIRTALTATSLAIPVADGRMMLGTWQGVFLAEHRIEPHQRSVAVHLSGA